MRTSVVPARDALPEMGGAQFFCASDAGDIAKVGRPDHGLEPSSFQNE